MDEVEEEAAARRRGAADCRKEALEGGGRQVVHQALQRGWVVHTLRAVGSCRCRRALPRPAPALERSAHSKHGPPLPSALPPRPPQSRTACAAPPQSRCPRGRPRGPPGGGQIVIQGLQQAPVKPACGAAAAASASRPRPSLRTAQAPPFHTPAEQGSLFPTFDRSAPRARCRRQCGPPNTQTHTRRRVGPHL